MKTEDEKCRGDAPELRAQKEDENEHQSKPESKSIKNEQNGLVNDQNEQKCNQADQELQAKREIANTNESTAEERKEDIEEEKNVANDHMMMGAEQSAPPASQAKASSDADQKPSLPQLFSTKSKVAEEE